MNVWVITSGDCTCCNWYVLGVFSTEEKANEAAAASTYRYNEIEECVIDERY